MFIIIFLETLKYYTVLWTKSLLDQNCTEFCIKIQFKFFKLHQNLFLEKKIWTFYCYSVKMARKPVSACVHQPRADGKAAHSGLATPHASPPTAQAATWAWAGKAGSRLGRFWLGQSWLSMPIGRLSVVFAGSKPPIGHSPMNPHSLPPLISPAHAPYPEASAASDENGRNGKTSFLLPFLYFFGRNGIEFGNGTRIYECTETNQYGRKFSGNGRKSGT
jgi:hypothetical protein